MARALVLVLALFPFSLQAATPYLMKDLETRSAPSGSLGSLAWMWPSRGPSVYFLADDGDGADLWTTDGTNTRTGPGVPEINRAAFVAQLGSTVIFSTGRPSRSFRTRWSSARPTRCTAASRSSRTARPRARGC